MIPRRFAKSLMGLFLLLSLRDLHSYVMIEVASAHAGWFGVLESDIHYPMGLFYYTEYM